jgi:hypothetical protein
MIRGVRYRESIPEAQNKHEALQAEAQARKAVYEGRYGRAIRSTPFERFVEEVFLHYAHSSEASRRRAVEALSQDCRKEPEKVRIFGQK